MPVGFQLARSYVQVVCARGAAVQRPTVVWRIGITTINRE